MTLFRPAWRRRPGSGGLLGPPPKRITARACRREPATATRGAKCAILNSQTPGVAVRITPLAQTRLKRKFHCFNKSNRCCRHEVRITPLAQTRLKLVRLLRHRQVARV